MKKMIIDRFEGSHAICELEDKSTTAIPKYKLPPECVEGDCLILDKDGMIKKDSEITKSREQTIREKMSRLFIK